MAAAGAARATAEEELEAMKTQSIEALKSSRGRTEVLRQGLQGSTALLAERSVTVAKLNLTLISVLASLDEKERRWTRDFPVFGSSAARI